jgi:hypothetical protein
MQVERAYHKTRSLSSPTPAKMLGDPHKSLRDRNEIMIRDHGIIVLQDHDISVSLYYNTRYTSYILS